MSISSKGLLITGIDDRRYWTCVSTDESRYLISTLLKQNDLSVTIKFIDRIRTLSLICKKLVFCFSSFLIDNYYLFDSL